MHSINVKLPAGFIWGDLSSELKFEMLGEFFGSVERLCLLSEAQLVTQDQVCNGGVSLALGQISNQLDAYDHLSPLCHLHPHNTCRTHVSWDGHSNTKKIPNTTVAT